MLVCLFTYLLGEHFCCHWRCFDVYTPNVWVRRSSFMQIQCKWYVWFGSFAFKIRKIYQTWTSLHHETIIFGAFSKFIVISQDVKWIPHSIYNTFTVETLPVPILFSMFYWFFFFCLVPNENLHTFHDECFRYPSFIIQLSGNGFLNSKCIHACVYVCRNPNILHLLWIHRIFIGSSSYFIQCLWKIQANFLFYQYPHWMPAYNAALTRSNGMYW